MSTSIYNSSNQLSDGSYNLGTLDASIVSATSAPKLKPVVGQATQQNLTGTPINKNLTTPVKRAGFGQQVNGFLSGKGAGIIGAASAATDIASSFVKTQEEKGKNPTGFDTQQKIGDAMTKIPIPIVQAAGVAYKALSAVAEATGGNTNTITKDQAEDIGISKGTRLLNNIVGTLHPGAGWFVDKIEEGQKSHLIDEMSNAYADTVADIDQAGVLGGGKYLFGSKKVADAVGTANKRNELLTEMNMTNTMRKKSDYGRDLAQQNLNRYAGTNYTDMRAGKLGMKLTELDKFKALLRNRIVEETENSDVQRFANGGSLMPQGYLHKERHHIEDISPELKDVITKKGIPVITFDESGSPVAVAEIERDEWVWSKEFTDTIELLWKDGSEEAMLNAGKLICEELLYNTQDEGNVIWAEEKQPKNS